MPMPYAGPVGNLVLETANAPGTAAAFTLGGAPSGWVGYVAGFGTGKTSFYFATDGVQAEWGTGLVTAGSLNTLSRGVAGNTQGTTQRLNFTGAVQVYNAVPAEWQPHFDVSNGTLPMAGRRLAGLGAGVAADDAPRLEQVAWRTLTTAYVSGQVAGVAFNLPPAFTRFRIEFNSAFALASGQFFLWFSADGGATYRQSSGDYTVTHADITPSGTTGGNVSATYAPLSPVSAFNFFGNVDLETINNKSFQFDVSSPNGGQPFRRIGAGFATFGAGINNVLIGVTATAISAGRFRLLGGF